MVSRFLSLLLYNTPLCCSYFNFQKLVFVVLPFWFGLFFISLPNNLDQYNNIDEETYVEVNKNEKERLWSLENLNINDIYIGQYRKKAKREKDH